MYSTLLLLLISHLVQLPACLRAHTLEARYLVPAGYVAAPYYPTPQGGWAADWTASYAKAAALVQNMTLAEKVNLTAGTGYDMGSHPPVQTSNLLLMLILFQVPARGIPAQSLD
jgi:hypothetical protein